MSTTKKPGKKPSFTLGLRDGNNTLHKVGAAWEQENGKGFNVKIGNTYYEMYQIMEKNTEGESA